MNKIVNNIYNDTHFHSIALKGWKDSMSKNIETKTYVEDVKEQSYDLYVKIDDLGSNIRDMMYYLESSDLESKISIEEFINVLKSKTERLEKILNIYLQLKSLEE